MSRTTAYPSFPYGILEVKTAFGLTPPLWVDNLIATGWIQPVAKFSKFQNTVATFYPEKIRTQPHWMCALPAPSVVAMVEGCKSTEAKAPPLLQHSMVKESSPLTVGHAVSAVPPPTRSSLSVKDNPTANKSGKLLITNLQKTKVEPKTYFANERTFIQWLGASILLVTLSIALSSIGGDSKIVGIIFVPVALIFMFYALGIYYWRLKKIDNRVTGRYDDPYGPWLLTLLLSTALVATETALYMQSTPSSLKGTNSLSTR